MLKGFEYLTKERGINGTSIRDFHLSYCDSHGNIYTNTSFPEKNLVLPEKFRNTVLFPIFDIYNRLIGISGRNLKDKLENEDLKYVNTVYPKTQHLYGLNLTWKDCLQKKVAYVVEGNVDVISLYQNGIRNVVGMLASTFKIHQACLLSRFVEEIVIVPDGDKSGKNIINKRIKRLIKDYNLDTRFSVIYLPDGYDPDNYVKKFGSDKLLQLEKILLSDRKLIY